MLEQTPTQVLAELNISERVRTGVLCCKTYLFDNTILINTTIGAAAYLLENTSSRTITEVKQC